MIKITKCDICGREIEPSLFFWSGNSVIIVNQKLDACRNCVNLILSNISMMKKDTKYFEKIIKKSDKGGC